MQVDPGKSWEPPIMVNGKEVFKGTFQSLYGGHHWGGEGSEGYGTAEWDNKVRMHFFFLWVGV